MSLTLALACIASVRDGDTLRLCSGERVRLPGINAPEMPGSPACRYNPRAWCGDWTLAYASRDALRAWLKRGPYVVVLTGRCDRYGRRLGTVMRGREDVRDVLVRDGLARPDGRRYRDRRCG